MGLLETVRRIAGRPDSMSSATGAAPRPDHPLYVVGDIHGCDDLLQQLISAIEEDIYERGIADAKIVLTGDYVDRGDRSADVIARIHALERGGDLPLVCLKGNHDEMLLAFIDRPDSGPQWLRYGGLQTLASYGITGLTEGAEQAAFERAAKQLRAALGPERETWLGTLPLTYRTGNVIVVHAGLDPDLPVDEQFEDVMLWGHPEFMRRARDDGSCVVHGHTVVETAEVLPGRIPVDTGAVFTGRLTAAALVPGEAPRFLET